MQTRNYMTNHDRSSNQMQRWRVFTMVLHKMRALSSRIHVQALQRTNAIHQVSNGSVHERRRNRVSANATRIYVGKSCSRTNALFRRILYDSNKLNILQLVSQRISMQAERQGTWNLSRRNLLWTRSHRVNQVSWQHVLSRRLELSKRVSNRQPELLEW